MNLRSVFVTLAVLALFPSRLHAQYDKYDAGVYAVTSDKVIPLECDFNPVSYGSGRESIFFPVSSTNYYKMYDGETSGVNVSGTFVLVAGHDQVAYVNPFDSEITPCSLKIISLEVNREEHYRECRSQDVLEIGDVSFISTPGGCEFEWYRIGENSFEIKMLDPKPGEYLIYIGRDKAVSFCFTIPDTIQENEGLLPSSKALHQAHGDGPGLYTVVDEKRIPLEYTYGGSFTNDGSPVYPSCFRYRDTTSVVNASSTFVYVTDSTDNVTFSPVNKWMNPNGLLLIPLIPDIKGRLRGYDMEVPADAVNTNLVTHVDFEWEKVDKHLFLIKVPSLVPGEYCFVVRRGKFGPFDFTRSYCFTVPER